MIERINLLLNNKYLNLRLRQAVFNQSNNSVYYLFSYPNALSVEERNEITKAVCDLTPNDSVVSVRIERDFITDKLLSQQVIEFFKSNHPHLLPLFSDERIEHSFIEATFNVILLVDEQLDKFLNKYKIINQLNETMKQFTSKKVEVSKKIVDIDIENTNQALKTRQNNVLRRILTTPIRKVKITNVKQLVGKQIFSQPNYILDLTEPVLSCVICGKISNINQKKTEKWNLFKMNLTDVSGTISVVYFYKIDAKSAITELIEGEEVVVYGKAVLNSFSNNIEVNAFSISRCKIVEAPKIPDCTNIINDDWLVIKPTKIKNEIQQNYFDSDNSVKGILNNNSFVAICLNTSGNNVLTSNISQFSAVKIVNGQLNEVLSSDIYRLSEDSSNLTINDIIPDLYKFCYGSAIISYNLEHDLSFLDYYAKYCNYFFDNKKYSVSALVSSYYNNQNTKKVTDINILNICEKLLEQTIPSDSSLDIATYTAKIFIKIIELSPNLLYNNVE